MTNRKRYFPKKNSIAWKAGVGQVFEIALPGRIMYIQIAHVDSRGATIVRVLGHRGKLPSNKIDQLVEKEELYYSYLTMSFRQMSKYFVSVGRFPVDEKWKQPPLFREFSIAGDKNNYHKFRMVGSPTWLDTSELDETLKNTPTRDYPSLPLFIMRLATDWSPAKETKEKVDKEPVSAIRFWRKYPGIDSGEIEKYLKSWRNLALEG
jgi:hypothetical protein